MNEGDSEKTEKPRGASSDSALSIVTKLVIIPLIIVAVAVGVFLLFGWLTYDHKSAEEFLADIKTAAPSKKWQAAFVLAGKLRDVKELGDTERLFQGMASILKDTADYDERVRSYMAMALGNLGDKRAASLLEEAIRTDSSGDVSIYAMWALGTLKAAESIPLLIEKARSEDNAIRKTALFVLGSFGSPDALPLLKSALEDPETDIRWNAAFALAQLGDRSGAPLLGQLLDRGYYNNFGEMSFQARSDSMVNALLSIAYLKDTSLISIVEKLSREDLSSQVRHIASQVLSALRELEKI